MEWGINELLDRLQTRDECSRIEAKESTNALGKSARETISAFSNEPDLGGGYLILGLKKNENESDDARYLLKGVHDPEKIQCELANACREEFNHRISPKIRVEYIKGVALVVAFIPESSARNKPLFIESLGVEKGTFRRIGPSDHRCTAEDLDLLYQLRSQTHYESEVLSDVSWEDISSEAVNEYRVRRAQIDPSAAELKLDDHQLLLSLKTAVKKGDQIIPTIGGLLLFGTKANLPKLFVTLTDLNSETQGIL